MNLKIDGLDSKKKPGFAGLFCAWLFYNMTYEL